MLDVCVYMCVYMFRACASARWVPGTTCLLYGCVCVRVYVHVYVDEYVHECVYVHIYIYIYIYIYVYVYTYMCMFIYIYIYWHVGCPAPLACCVNVYVHADTNIHKM